MSAEAPVRAARNRPRRTTEDRLRLALLALCDHRTTILDHREEPWASVTFAGARHSVSLLFAGDDAVAAGEQFIAVLPEYEFAIPGQLVADACVTEVAHRMTPFQRLEVKCELLLIEDA